MAIDSRAFRAATLLVGDGVLWFLIRQAARAGAPAAIATGRRDYRFGNRGCGRTEPLVLAIVLLLLASGTTCLTADRSLAQQSPEAQLAQTIENERSPGAGSDRPATGNQRDSTSGDQPTEPNLQRSTEDGVPTDTWSDDSDLLKDLFEDAAGQPRQPPPSSRPDAEDDPFDEIKSLLKEVDPRESLELELPESLRGGSVTDRAPREDDTAVSRQGAQGGNAADGYGAGSPVPAAPRQSQTTIGELQDLVVEVISDFRIYAYLLLSLGAVVGLFAIGVAIKWSRARQKRRRGRHHRRRRSRRRLAHS